MIPIVSIVGKSDSGKTTLIEKLLPELTKRGYRIATVKHDTHGFEMDREGKDSWRHKQAGAYSVVVSSPKKVALIRDVEKDLNLDEIREKFIHDVDLIITEGYKKDIQPKIEIFRKEKHENLLCNEDDNLIAVVTNKRFDIKVPQFDLEDIPGLANFIEERFLKSKKEEEIILKVDGKVISLKPFIKDFLSRSIKGMVSALKECEHPRIIEIKIETNSK